MNPIQKTLGAIGLVFLSYATFGQNSIMQSRINAHKSSMNARIQSYNTGTIVEPSYTNSSSTKKTTPVYTKKNTANKKATNPKKTAPKKTVKKTPPTKPKPEIKKSNLNDLVVAETFMNIDGDYIKKKLGIVEETQLYRGEFADGSIYFCLATTFQDHIRPLALTYMKDNNCSAEIAMQNVLAKADTNNDYVITDSEAKLIK